MKAFPRTALALAAGLALLASRLDGFAWAQEKKGTASRITVSCRTFLDHQEWPTGNWVPCLVSATNRGAAPVRIRMGIVPQTIPRGGRRPKTPHLRDAIASTEIEVQGSGTKKFFLYIPPQFEQVLYFLWESDGIVALPPTSLYIGNDSGRYCLVIGEGKREAKIAKALEPRFPTVASTTDGLPDRPEGYDPFHTIILHDFDPSSLAPAVLRSLRDWTVRGGLLVLAPGKKTALFDEPILREIHPFRSTAVLPPRVIRAFGELEAGRTPPLQPVHRLEGGETLMKTPRGEARVRGVKVGLGAALALATNLDVVCAMTPLGRHWFVRNVLLLLSGNLTRWGAILRFGRGGLLREEIEESIYDPQTKGTERKDGRGSGRIPAKPELGLTLANTTCFRHFLMMLDPEESYFESVPFVADFHVIMIRGLTGIPGIGLVALFLIVFMAVVGPLNYWFLRRRGAPALSAVTVPVISVAFVGIVILMGLVIKGGTKGNRLAVYETRSGQRWATRSAMTYFRTGREGMYALGAGEGIFPLPSVNPWATYRLEQGGEDRLLLPLDRWVVSGMQTETAVRLQGVVEARWEGEGAAIANGLSVPLERGLMLPPPGEEEKLVRPGWSEGFLLAKIAEVAAGGERRVPFLASRRGGLTDEDKILLTLLQHQKNVLNRGGVAFWIDRQFPAPSLDEGRLRLLRDRAAIILPFGVSPSALAGSPGEEGEEKR